MNEFRKKTLLNPAFDTSQKRIYNWLITGCILIILMIILGGITRLTQSGLSIVKWEPIMGTIPPLSDSEWEQSFDEYRKTPEFVHYNSHFELSDYKKIFFWEYLHRTLARLIGLVFIFPCLYFWVKGKFDTQTKKAVFIIFILGILQGILGWVMVKSGLKDVPHVSHYRLAAHLITALLLILYIYWVALRLKYVRKSTFSPIERHTWILLGLLLLQVIYGAFVAGLKAGLMYTTFPKMGSYWIAPELSILFEREGLMALVSTGSWVQFIHRAMAMVILGMYLIIGFKILRMGMNGIVRKSFRFVGLLLLTQITLGILTLLNAVPITLAAIHQAVAVVLILAVIHLLYNLKTIADDNN